MLSIISTNKFGDHCYQVVNSGVIEASKVETLPKKDKVWTIRNPSPSIIEYYSDKDCEIRTYNGVEYLLSIGARKVIPLIQKNYGSAGVLNFVSDGIRYFVLVADNKTYIQNPQGGLNTGETDVECVIREIREELGVIVRPDQCVKIGSYGFSSVNKLVGDFKFSSITSVFNVEVSLSQVSHLIGDKVLDVGGLNIFSSEDYDFELDETQFVIIVSEKMVREYSETIFIERNKRDIQYKWTEQHREILLRLQKIRRYKMRHLRFFDLSV